LKAGTAAPSDAQIELRWHIASIIPRLKLSSAQRLRAFARFKENLEDRSSIVNTFARQASADLAGEDQATQSEVAELLAHASRTGSPAMRACARKLFALF
jgi:hypothetical protein